MNIFEVSIHFYYIKCEYLAPNKDSFAKSVSFKYSDICTMNNAVLWGKEREMLCMPQYYTEWWICSDKQYILLGVYMFFARQYWHMALGLYIEIHL